MKIFTLWNQTKMPDSYAKCISNLKNYYDIEVIKFKSSGKIDTRLIAERIRLEILRDTPGDVLYLDPDIVAGKDIWTGSDSPSCCASFNHRGGLRDTCAIWKPSGCEWQIQEALDSGRNQDILYYVYFRGFNPIRGYPGYNYFSHLHLGGPVRSGNR